MKYGFGVDLGGTTVKIAFFDSTGCLRDKWEIPTDKNENGKHILEDIARAIHSYLKEHAIASEQVLGVGIGVPGSVDSQGVVAGCDNLGWGSFNVAQRLESLVGFPVRAGNDANMAALGENWQGGGKGCSDMLLITLGTGMGGGLVLGGKVLCGTTGAAGEIGHLVLNREETRRCSCGKQGCAEQYCSATGIVRMAQEYLQQHPITSALREKDPLTCKDVFDLSKAGDPAAQAVLERFYAYMGELTANLCIVLNPQAVVFGGGVSKAGQALLDGIKPYFDRYIYHASTQVAFRLAALGNDAGAYGAFKLILDQAQ